MKHQNLRNPFQLFQSFQGLRKCQKYQNLKYFGEKDQADSKHQAKMIKQRIWEKAKREIGKNIDIGHKDQQVDQIGGLRNQMAQTYEEIIRKKITCEICLQFFYKQINASRISSDCQHYYCINCLKNHAISSLQKRRLVICPYQNCNKTLDIKGALFHLMSRKFKKDYMQLQRKIQVMNDPSLKFCPNSKCKNGVINLIQCQKSNPRCTACQNQFCKQCWMIYHTGECDKHIISIYKKNLKYKQCPRCHILIQRNQGCDHMTCRCLFQFCYICQSQWGNHKDNCPFHRANQPVTDPMNQYAWQPRRTRRFTTNPILQFDYLTTKKKTLAVIVIFILIFLLIQVSQILKAFWVMILILIWWNLTALFLSKVGRASRSLILPFLISTLLCLAERYINNSWIFVGEIMCKSYEVLYNQ